MHPIFTLITPESPLLSMVTGVIFFVIYIAELIFYSKHFRRMKVSLLIVAMLISTTGCGIKSVRLRTAKKALEEKYNETFEVSEVYDDNGRYPQFTAIARSVSRPWIPIRASVANDGSYIEDNYLSKIIGERIADTLKENIGELDGKYYIYVSALSGNRGLSNTLISIADYVAYNPKNKFTISLYYAPEHYDADLVYDKLSGSLENLEMLNGYLFVHIIDQKNLHNIREYIETHAFFEKEDYMPYLKNEVKVQIPYADGKLRAKPEVFAEKTAGVKW